MMKLAFFLVLCLDPVISGPRNAVFLGERTPGVVSDSLDFLDDFNTASLSQQESDMLSKLSGNTAGRAILRAIALRYQFHTEATREPIRQLLTKVGAKSLLNTLGPIVESLSRKLSGCPEGSFNDGSGTCNPCRTCRVGLEKEAHGCSSYQDRKCEAICPGAVGSRSGGQYMDQRTSTCTMCTPCPDGASVKQACDGISDRQCQACPAGFDSRGSLLECVECVPGTYQPSIGSPCIPCTRYDSANGKDCPAGMGLRSYCTSTSNQICSACNGTNHEFLDNFTSTCQSCLSCPVGTSATCATQDSDCKVCPSGTGSEGGFAPCVPCQPNSFSNVSVASARGVCRTCDSCSVGYEAVPNSCTSTTNTVCKAKAASCPVGQYMSPTTSSCTKCKCAAGQEVQLCLNWAELVCQSCGLGNVSNGEGPCTKCAESGTSLAKGGKYSPNQKDCVACIDCPAAKIVESPCTANKDRKCADCPSNEIPKADQSGCTPCPLGEFPSQNICKKCEGGFTPKLGAACRPYTTPSTGEAILTQGTASSDHVLTCAAGYYRDQASKKCKACPQGTFKAEKGDDCFCTQCCTCKSTETECSSTKNTVCKAERDITTMGAQVSASVLLALILALVIPGSKWIIEHPYRQELKSSRILFILLTVVATALLLPVPFTDMPSSASISLVVLGAVFFLGALTLALSVTRGGLFDEFKCDSGEFIHQFIDKSEHKVHGCVECSFSGPKCQIVNSNLVGQECTGTEHEDISKCHCPAGYGVRLSSTEDFAGHIGNFHLAQLVRSKSSVDFVCQQCEEDSFSMVEPSNWFNRCRDCPAGSYSLSRLSCAPCGRFAGELGGKLVHQTKEYCPAKFYELEKTGPRKFADKFCTTLTDRHLYLDTTATIPSVVCGCEAGYGFQLGDGSAYECQGCEEDQFSNENPQVTTERTHTCSDCPEGYFSPRLASQCFGCGQLGPTLAAIADKAFSDPDFRRCPQKHEKDIKSFCTPEMGFSLAEPKHEAELECVLALPQPVLTLKYSFIYLEALRSVSKEIPLKSSDPIFVPKSVEGGGVVLHVDEERTSPTLTWTLPAEQLFDRSKGFAFGVSDQPMKSYQLEIKRASGIQLGEKWDVVAQGTIQTRELLDPSDVNILGDDGSSYTLEPVDAGAYRVVVPLFVKPTMRLPHGVVAVENEQKVSTLTLSKAGAWVLHDQPTDVELFRLNVEVLGLPSDLRISALGESSSLRVEKNKLAFSTLLKSQTVTVAFASKCDAFLRAGGSLLEGTWESVVELSFDDSADRTVEIVQGTTVVSTLAVSAAGTLDVHLFLRQGPDGDKEEQEVKTTEHGLEARVVLTEGTELFLDCTEDSLGGRTLEWVHSGKTTAFKCGVPLAPNLETPVDLRVKDHHAPLLRIIVEPRVLQKPSTIEELDDTDGIHEVQSKLSSVENSVHDRTVRTDESIGDTVGDRVLTSQRETETEIGTLGHAIVEPNVGVPVVQSQGDIITSEDTVDGRVQSQADKSRSEDLVDDASLVQSQGDTIGTTTINDGKVETSVVVSGPTQGDLSGHV